MGNMKLCYLELSPTFINKQTKKIAYLLSLACTCGPRDTWTWIWKIMKYFSSMFIKRDIYVATQTVLTVLPSKLFIAILQILRS